MTGDKHREPGPDVSEGQPGLLLDGRGSSLAGACRAFRRGLTDPFPPSEVTDLGPFWSGRQLGERGLELLIRFAAPQYVDRVVIGQEVRRQPLPSESVGGLHVCDERPVGQAMEAAELQVTAGIGRVEAFTRSGAETNLCLAAVVSSPDSGLLGERIVIEVGVEAVELVLSLESFRRDIQLRTVEVWGGPSDQPAIYPQPRVYRRLPGARVRLDPAVFAEASDGPDPDVSIAASVIREALAAIPEANAGPESDATPVQIRLAAGGASGGLLPEGYRLQVKPDGVEIVGADRRGLIYGAAALAQLLAQGGSEGTEPCSVEDGPKMGLRGVHLYMPSRANVPFFRRLIRHVLAPMRYNTIILEVGAAMEYKRRPEINAAWVRDKELAERGEHPGTPHIEVGDGGFLTQAEVRDLVDYANRYGIDVIPEVQALSHVEFLTMAYPDIAEKPDDVHPDCYCPSNERSYEVLFDVIDEIVAVFRPLRYVHMGHDEAYSMCLCDKCRNVPKADLFVRDVNRIYDYLRAKGLGMMIWDDMVHTTRHFACPDAIDRIPKDIVLLNFVWYDRTDIDTEDRLLDRAFPVMIGNFYSSHFPRFATREGKPGLVGAEVSTWCRAAEEDYGRVGKLYDFIYSANMMWSGHYRDELRRLYSRRIASMLPPIRDALHGCLYPSRQPAARFQPLRLERASTPRRDQCGALGGYDLEALCVGEQRLGGVPFTIEENLLSVGASQMRAAALPSLASVTVGRRCNSIVFLHTCTRPGTPSTYNGRAQPVARYTLVYDDGSQAHTSIEYGWQLAEWNRPFGAPLRHGFWRHSGYTATYPALPFWQGKSARGEDVTLHGYELINPNPERTVARLEISVPDEAGDAALLLVAATAVYGGE